MWPNAAMIRSGNPCRTTPWITAFREAHPKLSVRLFLSDQLTDMFRDPVEAVIARTKSHVEHTEEPLSAVIQGVDDAWEVCLLKFTIDMIERSSGGNLGDFRKRGLI